MRGLLRLTWLEIKIFVREPMGVVATVLVPVLIFVFVARTFHGEQDTPEVPAVFTHDLPVLAAMLIAISTVLSLMTVIAIYREGGILKRLRATPLRPWVVMATRSARSAATASTIALSGRSYQTVERTAATPAPRTASSACAR